MEERTLLAYFNVIGHTEADVKRCLQDTASESGSTIEEVVSNVLKSVDIFDFDDVHRKSFNRFRGFYSGVELFLRSAVYASYKNYLFLQQGESAIQNLDASIAMSMNPKKLVDKITNMVDIQALLASWYLHYNPDMILKTEEILEKFVTCEDVLFNRLYRKYVDKNPGKPDQKLWFASCKRPKAKPS